jgi:hypothetical protein
MIRFTKQQIEHREHERLNPDRYDFHWDANFTECVAVPLLWTDGASYERYQGEAFEYAASLGAGEYGMPRPVAPEPIEYGPGDLPF